MFTATQTPSYLILPANSSASGPLTLTQSGSYVWDTRGTYAGALETLKQAGADGSLVTVASKSSPGATCVVLTTPQGSTTPNTQDQLSGATGTPSLTSTLTYAPSGCGGGLPTTVNGVTPAWGASGVPAVTGTFGSAASTSATTAPAAGRPVDLDLLYPAGATCTINLQRYETTLATWFTTDTFTGTYGGSFVSNETGRQWRLQSLGCTGSSVTYAVEH